VRIEAATPMDEFPEVVQGTSDLIPDPAELSRWPGRDRRHPLRSDRHYLVLSSLSRQLHQEIEMRLSGRTGISVLDAGCGSKPYLPFVAGYASRYCGLDAVPGDYVDDVGGVEEMPYEDESFDLVLCTQVFEHLEDPGAAAREIYRVLRPGGVALTSTHGVFLYHPDPPGSDHDYWRWTHSGLVKLFRDSASWSDIQVHANGDFVACIGYLLCQFVDEAAGRILPDKLRRAVIAGLNRAAEVLDQRFPPRARVPRPGSLSANYLLVATK
jgi:SAM-dependent methyltransferase